MPPGVAFLAGDFSELERARQERRPVNWNAFATVREAPPVTPELPHDVAAALATFRHELRTHPTAGWTQRVTEAAWTLAKAMDDAMPEQRPRTVYVLVFWPGNPEDHPPKVLAAADSLDRAKQAATDHARDQLGVEPPDEWTVDDDGAHIGQLTPENPDDGFYAEQREYAIHPQPVLE